MKILYLNTENLYPHDLHLIDGLKKCGHEIKEVAVGKSSSYISLGKNIIVQSKGCDVIIVGFTSPILAIIARLVTVKKIFFNGVSSQYEANAVSRNTDNKRTILNIKWWIVDFISFHLPTKVLLESSAQIDYIHRLFLVPKKKLVLSYSGVSEHDFYYDSNVKKLSKFTVLFRGRFLPESGILTVIEAAKILENTNIDFLVIGHGFLYREVNALIDELKPKNIKMINERIEMGELRKMMLECHISLGQLADHPRLARTLPCKLFESLALRLPYVTGRNIALLEVLEDNKSCITVNPGDAHDLALKIVELSKDMNRLDQIAVSGYKLYKEKLTSEILARKVIESCMKQLP